MGNTGVGGSCGIRIEEADFNRHNGTWTCVVNSYGDTVNVTVTNCESDV